jgi:hypothetical protein
MPDLSQLESRWYVLNKDLAWAPLKPPAPPEDLPLYELPFSTIIIVRSKSDSPTGKAAHNHLLGVLRGDPESTEGLDINTDELLEIPEDYRFTLLRTNAEVPANPIHHMFVIGVNTAAKTVAGFDYKQHRRR